MINELRRLRALGLVKNHDGVGISSESLRTGNGCERGVQELTRSQVMLPSTTKAQSQETTTGIRARQPSSSRSPAAAKSTRGARVAGRARGSPDRQARAVA